jgi:hypothetical protein
MIIYKGEKIADGNYSEGNVWVGNMKDGEELKDKRKFFKNGNATNESPLSPLPQ